MIEKVRSLPIAVSTTETEVKEVTNVRDIVFSINGTAATYTIQTSLDGTNFADFVAGTAVGLGTYTMITAKDIHTKYVRIKSSLATAAEIKFLVRY